MFPTPPLPISFRPIVFGSKAEMDKLNAIMWPAIAALVETKLASIRSEVGEPTVVVMEAAVLVEAQWQYLCDEVWVVVAPTKVRLERLCKRNNLQEDEARKRIEAQLPSQQRAIHADLLLSSEFGPEFMQEQLEDAWKGVQMRATEDPTVTDTLAARWFRLVHDLRLKDPAARKWWRLIRRRYTERQRFYHTLDHLDAMFAWYDQVPTWTNPAAIQLSIFFHDIIYDPLRGDNEARSAAVFEEFAAEVALPDNTRDIVSAYILRTAKHHSGEGETTGDLALFLDIDLSILGCSSAGYSRYAEEIRLEYQHVPSQVFAEKRAAILTSFLDNKTIFFSKMFSSKMEASARRNVALEINALSNWKCQ